MMIDSNAPVVLAAEIQIATPADVVWDVLTNVQEWPTWHPGIRSVVADRAPGLEMTFHTDESMTGLVPRLMGRQLHKSVQKDLDTWLQNLGTEAEQRASS